MTAQNQNPTHPQQPFYPEDEIELMDYLLVLWKWKYLILIGTIIFGLTAAVVSFSMPKAPPMYRVEMVLEPGVAKIDENGNKVYIEPPASIKSRIQNELKYEILNKIKDSGESGLSQGLDYQLTIPENSNLLKVFYESNIAEEGVKKLNYLSRILLENYAEKVVRLNNKYEEDLQLRKNKLDLLRVNEEQIKREYEKSIDLKKNQLADYKMESEIEAKSINDMVMRLHEINAKKRFIKENTELLLKQREILATNLTQNNALAALAYTNNIQQNLSLEITIQQQIDDYLTGLDQKKGYLYKIEKQIEIVSKEITELEKAKGDSRAMSILKPDLYAIEKQIETLTKEKNNIKTIQILQSPTPTQLPPKTIKTKRNVILASVVGLFMMVFLAFFIEYIKKYKDRGEIN